MKVLCKKDLINNYVKGDDLFNMSFKINNLYEVSSEEKNGYWIIGDGNQYSSHPMMRFSKNDNDKYKYKFYEYFCSKREERKIKLNKIKNGI